MLKLLVALIHFGQRHTPTLIFKPRRTRHGQGRTEKQPREEEAKAGKGEDCPHRIPLFIRQIGREDLNKERTEVITDIPAVYTACGRIMLHNGAVLIEISNSCKHSCSSCALPKHPQLSDKLWNWMDALEASALKGPSYWHK